MMPFIWAIGAAAAAFGFGWFKGSETNDEPVTVKERKGARTKWIVGAIAAVAVWAIFKGRQV